MSSTAFDATVHPRDTGSGRFTEKSHSTPDATLPTTHADVSAPEARAAIDEVTRGRASLSERLAGGEYTEWDLRADRRRLWENASGHRVSDYGVEAAMNADTDALFADGASTEKVEAALEVAFYRASGSSYTHTPESGLRHLPIGEMRLREIAATAEHNAALVTAQWESGSLGGPSVELDAVDARDVAEEAFTFVTERGMDSSNFPRIAEMAWRPYSEASLRAEGVPAEVAAAKCDDFGAELAQVYAHELLTPARAARFNALGTYAIHGHQ